MAAQWKADLVQIVDLINKRQKKRINNVLFCSRNSRDETLSVIVAISPSAPLALAVLAF